jgi:nucleotide-binding universal stress UspA family protein
MHARSADLVIAAKSDPEFEDSMMLDFPETLATDSGRPTLIVPRSAEGRPIGRRITVAWNGRREAARATFDALPLLETADDVRLLWVNPEDDPRGAGDLPTIEIAATLARHGIKCEAAQSRSTDLKVGDEILARLADHASDLLVMGAYGHTRMREFIFGGTTRHILKHMTVPVLLSH